MDLKSQLTARLEEALKSYLKEIGGNVTVPAPTVEVPRNPENGDFSTNIAMQLTRILKRPPMQVAEEFLDHFNPSGLVRESSIAKPGFINFKISDEATSAILARIAEEGSAYGRTQTGAGVRVLVEFVSANPTGPLHIGHARNTVVGDVLARLLDATGHSVTREYYYNDAGVQMNTLGNTLRLRVAELLGREVKWPESYYKGDYMIDIARQMLAEVPREEIIAQLDGADAQATGSGSSFVPAEGVEGEDVENAEVATPGHNPYAYFTNFSTGKILPMIDADLKATGIAFDSWFLERSLYESGSVEKTLNDLREHGVIYEADGAVWFRASDFGVNRDRVVVKSDGNYTYLMPDIAYNQQKYSRGYQRLITLLGADHHGQISSLVAAAVALGQAPETLQYVLYQLVTLLKDGVLVKLSTRAGEFITMKEMIDELGAGVVRYFFTMRSPESQMVFDWGLAKDTSMDNPVYYVQYAHARCCSIFRKAEEYGMGYTGLTGADLTLLKQPEEQAIMRALERLPETIDAAARDLAPHYMTTYMQELATLFHTYFTRGTNDAALRFIVPGNPALTHARLALIDALKTTLGNALRVIGIEPMERM